MEKQEFKGELRHIEPHRLIKEEVDDIVANFFLVLGVVYNDLNGLILFEKLIIDTYRKEQPEEVSVQVGNLGGIFTQINKLIVSNIREFFDFLKENEKVLLSIEFKEVLLKTNKDIQNRWEGITDFAFGRSLNSSEFTKYLILIRNNVAFHYNQSGKELKKSFCNYFYKKEKFGTNNLAGYSIGEKIEDTRFFYADAAVQEYMGLTKNDKPGGFDLKYKKEISGIMFDMNFAISRLLKAYLKNRPK